MLFASKEEKQKRLEQEVSLMASEGEISIEQMARRCGVDRATIERDLLALADKGVPVYEGKRGRLGLAEWFNLKKLKK